MGLEVGTFGCERCYGDNPASTWEFVDGGLICETWLIDDSHFQLAIRRCPECDQRFLWHYTELTDFSGGPEPEYWDVLPLELGEARRLGAQGEDVDLAQVAALSAGRRYLKVNYPANVSAPQPIWDSGPPFVVRVS